MLNSSHFQPPLVSQYSFTILYDTRKGKLVVRRSLRWGSPSHISHQKRVPTPLWIVFLIPFWVVQATSAIPRQALEQFGFLTNLSESALPLVYLHARSLTQRLSFSMKNRHPNFANSARFMVLEFLIPPIFLEASNCIPVQKMHTFLAHGSKDRPSLTVSSLLGRKPLAAAIDPG